MRHIKAINQKARRIDDLLSATEGDIEALQQSGGAERPHYPMGWHKPAVPPDESTSHPGENTIEQPIG